MSEYSDITHRAFWGIKLFDRARPQDTVPFMDVDGVRHSLNVTLEGKPRKQKAVKLDIKGLGANIKSVSIMSLSEYKSNLKRKHK